jgi:hypothetical protein
MELHHQLRHSGAAQRNPRKRWFIYGGAAVLVVALVILGIFTFSSAKSTKEADQKAKDLIGKLETAGLPVPSQDTITRVLGTDGGALCDTPGGSLDTALAKISLSNGADGPGQRPVITSREVVLGEALAIQVYCPDQLAAYTKYLNELKFASVINN